MVLRHIAHAIQSFLNTNKVFSQGVKKIHFVKETGVGVKKRRRKPSFGLLHKASDFVLDVDLDRRLKYPEHIASYGRRPDIVIYSNSLKLVIHIELTCPVEENFQVRHNEKLSRYGVGSDLEARCESNGWSPFCFAVEVGARGYAATLLRTVFRKLGLGKVRTRTAIKDATDASLRASFWIWLLRDRQKWDLSKGFKNHSSNNMKRQPQDKRVVMLDKCNPKKREVSTSNVTQVNRVVIVDKCDTGKREVSTRNITQSPNTKSPTENSDIRIVVDKVPLEPPGGDPVPRTDDNNINHPSGIKNIGATCYMNSIIQCINPMMDHNHSNRVISTLLTSDPMLPIAKELSQLCLKVNRYRSVISHFGSPSLSLTLTSDSVNLMTQMNFLLLF